MSRPGIIEVEPPQTCELCGAFEETRPYGPNGERICYACGQKDVATTARKLVEYLFGHNPPGQGDR